MTFIRQLRFPWRRSDRSSFWQCLTKVLLKPWILGKKSPNCGLVQKWIGWAPPKNGSDFDHKIVESPRNSGFQGCFIGCVGRRSSQELCVMSHSVPLCLGICSQLIAITCFLGNLALNHWMNCYRLSRFLSC